MESSCLVFPRFLRYGNCRSVALLYTYYYARCPKQYHVFSSWNWWHLIKKTKSKAKRSTNGRVSFRPEVTRMPRYLRSRLSALKTYLDQMFAPHLFVCVLRCVTLLHARTKRFAYFFCILQITQEEKHMSSRSFWPWSVTGLYFVFVLVPLEIFPWYPKNTLGHRPA